MYSLCILAFVLSIDIAAWFSVTKLSVTNLSVRSLSVLCLSVMCLSVTSLSVMGFFLATRSSFGPKKGRIHITNPTLSMACYLQNIVSISTPFWVRCCKAYFLERHCRTQDAVGNAIDMFLVLLRKFMGLNRSNFKKKRGGGFDAQMPTFEI